MNGSKWKWGVLWLMWPLLSLWVSPAHGQGEPVQIGDFVPLPNDPNGYPAGVNPVPRRIPALTSFESAPTAVGGQHSDVPKPPILGIDNPGQVLVPTPGAIPRYYIYCYYYGCRPWFVHPYRGTDRPLKEILSSVRYTNPDWLDCARRISPELDLEVLASTPDDQLGEPLVQVDALRDPETGEEIPIDENNQEAIADWQQTQQAEQINFDAANTSAIPNLRPSIRPIYHAPYYGLYCLRVRICVPIIVQQNHWGGAVGGPTNFNQIRRWRFWCRFPYVRHQPICWKRWWWWRHYPSWPGTTGIVLRPWRPWCLPYVNWTRSGPDYVAHVTSVNRWRHWCLYGFRYYFKRIGPNPQLIQFDLTTNAAGQTILPSTLPRIASLNSTLDPAKDSLTTGWRRPWPYPFVRYWPYRPYCTRWYWFRCLPWWWYRHFPPVIHFSVATPKLEYGGGFDPNPPIQGLDDPVNPLFPDDPPNLADGQVQSEIRAVGASSFDSFFDIDVECRGRAELRPLGDLNGNGIVRALEDYSQAGIRQLETIQVNPDTADEDEEDPPAGG